MSLRDAVSEIAKNMSDRVEHYNSNGQSLTADVLHSFATMLNLALKASEGEWSPEPCSHEAMMRRGEEANKLIQKQVATNSLNKNKLIHPSYGINDLDAELLEREVKIQEGCEGTMVECMGGDMDTTMVMIDKSMPINSHTILSNEVYTLKMIDCVGNKYRVLEFDPERTDDLRKRKSQ